MKRYIEGITLIASIIALSGIDSNLYCGFVGIVFLIIFCIEANMWEGRESRERNKDTGYICDSERLRKI